jgi:hypothetical protein
MIRRLLRSWDNFERLYRPLADAWAIYENSDRETQWREDLESKEETSVAEFRCGSRAGAAESRERCSKDCANVWNTIVRLGKRKDRSEETLAHGCV